MSTPQQFVIIRALKTNKGAVKIGRYTIPAGCSTTPITLREAVDLPDAEGEGWLIFESVSAKQAK
jgi:hypothetical protein